MTEEMVPNLVGMSTVDFVRDSTCRVYWDLQWTYRIVREDDTWLSAEALTHHYDKVVDDLHRLNLAVENGIVVSQRIG